MWINYLTAYVFINIADILPVNDSNSLMFNYYKFVMLNK